MALSGNWTKYEYTPHETEVNTVTITYPSEMFEGDQNYEKRGTTETTESPVLVETSTTYEGVYIAISCCSVQKMETGLILNYIYKVYNSQEDRNNDPLFTNPFYEDHITTDYDPDGVITNAYILSYNHLNSLKGFDSLTGV